MTTWKKTREEDDFHDTILNIEDLKACYIDGRNKSNEGRVSIDHKEPIVTEISIIELKKDEKSHRPYVHLVGMKAVNAITLITKSHRQSNWKLYNNVLPQVAVTRGMEITSEFIMHGEDGKVVTPKMASPGTKRKPLKTDNDEDPKVINSQFKSRTKFIKKGRLENYLKRQLNITI